MKAPDAIRRTPRERRRPAEEPLQLGLVEEEGPAKGSWQRCGIGRIEDRKLDLVDDHRVVKLASHGRPSLDADGRRAQFAAQEVDRGGGRRVRNPDHLDAPISGAALEGEGRLFAGEDEHSRRDLERRMVEVEVLAAGEDEEVGRGGLAEPLLSPRGERGGEGAGSGKDVGAGRLEAEIAAAGEDSVRAGAGDHQRELVVVGLRRLWGDAQDPEGTGSGPVHRHGLQ